MVVIDWENDLKSSQYLSFYSWLRRIADLKMGFQAISFRHIYKKNYVEVYSLSKESVGVLVGHLQFFEYVKGVLVDEGCYSCFS